MRFLKDTVTGNYYKTHTTDLTVNSVANTGAAVLGSYLYVSCLVGGAEAIRRYLASDLSGVTTITLSGTAKYGCMWSDGTDLWIMSAASSGSDWTKFTISGTTATNAGDTTFTSSNADTNQKGCVSDGTNVWLSSINTGSLSIRKYAIAGGAVISTTVVIVNADSYLNGTNSKMAVGLFMGSSTILGFIHAYNNTSATAIVGTSANIFGITLP